MMLVMELVPVKVCTKCFVEKPEGAFHFENRRNKYTAACKRCINDSIQDRRRANPEQEKARKRRIDQRHGRAYRLKSKFGITIERYEEMLAEQGGVCGICERTERIKGRRLAVDHSHESGRIRGLLCSACNQSLGHLGDDINGVMRAVEYLKRAGETVAPNPKDSRR